MSQLYYRFTLDLICYVVLTIVLLYNDLNVWAAAAAAFGTVYLYRAWQVIARWRKAYEIVIRDMQEEERY